MGEFVREMVFTGGAIRSFYFERPPLDPIRLTDDTDAVVECASYVAYNRLLARLRVKGFEPVPSDEHPLCRVRSPKGHLLDVMPTAAVVLSFGNPWFAEGFKQAVVANLDSGMSLRIFPSLLYAAAKVQAYKDRGQRDPWTSQDLEDLLTLIECRPSLEVELAQATKDVRVCLRGFAQTLSDDPNLDELIQCHLGASRPGWRERIAGVVEAVERIAALE